MLFNVENIPTTGNCVEVMSSSSERSDNGQSEIAEYRGKFPEIPEDVLAKIVREHGADPETCQNHLEEESKKYMYGSSPTYDDPSPIKTVVHPKSDPKPKLDFTRSNSTGSTSSGQSSGRSTPVNQIPTPWVVPRFHSPLGAGHQITPNPFQTLPSSGIPSRMVYSPMDGKYYQPWPGAGTPPVGGFIPVSGGQQISPGQSRYTLLNENSQGNYPVLTSRVKQTSPNTGCPVPPSTSSSVSGNSPTGNVTSVSALPTSIYAPSTAGDQTMVFAPGYYTLPNNPSFQHGVYYQPDMGHDKVPYSAGQFNTIHQTLPTSMAHIPGSLVLPNALKAGERIDSPALAASAVSKSNQVALYGSPSSSIPVSGSRTQNSVSSGWTNINNTYQTLPTNMSYPYEHLTTLSSHGTHRQTELSSSVPSSGLESKYNMANVNKDNMKSAYVPSSHEVHMPGGHGSVFRQGSLDSTTRLATLPQVVGNEDYLRACLAQQWKRFQNLEKEFCVEKERLEIIIRDISERDHDLYDRRYRVAPNPTAEQIQQLAQENKHLQRTIDEISKNIDRLDNGQAVLHQADPRVHNTHRFSPRHKEHYDRSQSVPCIPGSIEPGQPKQPLNRPLSEHDLNINLDRRRVEFRVTPPPDASLRDWSMINRETVHPTPDPIPPPVNSDEGEQWSCSQCTFLNHEYLLACEMCGKARS